MIKKYYFQLKKDKTIVDVVEYENKSYIEAEIDGALPVGVNGGWWSLIDGKLVELPDKNPNNIETRIKIEIDAFTMTLVEKGLL